MGFDSANGVLEGLGICQCGGEGRYSEAYRLSSCQ